MTADCQSDRLSQPAEYLYQRIDRELGLFLVHHIEHSRAQQHQAPGPLEPCSIKTDSPPQLVA
jgi:hypothetical protein